MVPSVPSTNAQAGRKVLAEVRQSRSLGSTKFVLTVNWVISARKPLLQPRYCRRPWSMAVTATTVKKPSGNSPIKQANRRRCERKQTP